MTSHHSDILLPRAAWGAAINRSRIVAFVPILVALIGIGVVLAGGISARTSEPATAAAATAVDPITTGSIPAGRLRALRMLDR